MEVIMEMSQRKVHKLLCSRKDATTCSDLGKYRQLPDRLWAKFGDRLNSLSELYHQFIVLQYQVDASDIQLFEVVWRDTDVRTYTAADVEITRKQNNRRAGLLRNDREEHSDGDLEQQQQQGEREHQDHHGQEGEEEEEAQQQHHQQQQQHNYVGAEHRHRHGQEEEEEQQQQQQQHQQQQQRDYVAAAAAADYDDADYDDADYEEYDEEEEPEEQDGDEQQGQRCQEPDAEMALVGNYNASPGGVDGEDRDPSHLDSGQNDVITETPGMSNDAHVQVDQSAYRPGGGCLQQCTAVVDTHAAIMGDRQVGSCKRPAQEDWTQVVGVTASQPMLGSKRPRKFVPTCHTQNQSAPDKQRIVEPVVANLHPGRDNARSITHIHRPLTPTDANRNHSITTGSKGNPATQPTVGIINVAMQRFTEGSLRTTAQDVASSGQSLRAAGLDNGEQPQTKAGRQQRESAKGVAAVVALAAADGRCKLPGDKVQKGGCAGRGR